MIPSQATTDEIDLRGLVLTLWTDRFFILKCSFAAIILSAIYAFFVAKPVFVSSALLVPTEQPSIDQLGAAAALLGKKTSGQGDLDLYQSLLTSRIVLSKLLIVKIRNENDSAKGRLEPLFQVLALDTSDRIKIESKIGALTKSISVGTKESGVGGIVEVRVEARYAWLAQQMCEQLLVIGQDELRAIRRDRYTTILSSLGEAVDGAKIEWDTIASKYATYRDQNRSALQPTQLLEMARLEIEKSAKEQKYLLARREFETLQLEKAKASAPMVILDPANLPAKKSKPKRLFILCIGAICGSLLAATWTSLKTVMKSPSKDLSNG